MKQGESIPGLIGWEFHGDPPSDLLGLEIVGQGTAWQGSVNPSPWTATMYPSPQGIYVFNAATIFWAKACVCHRGTRYPGAIGVGPTVPIRAYSKSPPTCFVAQAAKPEMEMCGR